MAFAFPTPFKATLKLTERLYALARYMGSFSQPNAPEGFSESSGAIGHDATINVSCSGSVLGLQSAFHPRVSEGNENNGINPGYEAPMSKGIDNIELHKLPDGYLIGDRLMDDQRGSLLFAISPLAREAASRLGYMSLEVKVLIVWVPECNNEDVAPTLEAQGAEISCV